MRPAPNGRPVCATCGGWLPDSCVCPALCDCCGGPTPCHDHACERERAERRAEWAEYERDVLHLWRNR